MSMRHTTKARRGAAVAALVAGLALAVAGCGSGDGDDGKKPDDGSPQKPTASEDERREQEPAADSSKSIGQMKGPGGVEVSLHSAVRDSGGFVTVSGTLTNRGSGYFYALNWSSKEQELAKSRSSLSGASLIDKSGKKRYLVLRDTDGLCLCTTGLSGIKPNESRPVFAQFPAPPKDVKEVDFQIPTMPSISIELSG
ncbi:hypothetical protein [Streptomyces cucumeris]|uniref:hypothetical protein n=1 Tax=Streptomyces cucumeris TaxID=2962890 RepID=UPI003D70CD1A